LKGSFTLSDVNFEMVSMENGRALYRCTNPGTVNSVSLNSLAFEISHLATKGNLQRSMVKITGEIPGADLKMRTFSAHIVLSFDPHDANARSGADSALLRLLVYLAYAGINRGVTVEALEQGIFVPETYADPTQGS